SRMVLISSSVRFSRSIQRRSPLSARTRRRASIARSWLASLPSLKTKERIMDGARSGRDGGFLLGRGGGEQGGPGGIVAQQAAQGADDGEVVAGFGLGRAEHEEKPDDLAGLVDDDARIAAADGEDDLADVLGAGVGQGDAIAEAGGIEPVAGEQPLVEAREVSDLRMTVEEAGNFIERCRPLRALQVKRDARGIEERGDFSSHGSIRQHSWPSQRRDPALARVERRGEPLARSVG